MPDSPPSSIDITPDEAFRPAPVVKPTYNIVAAALPRHGSPQLLHSGMTVEKFFSLHVAGTALPVAAGLILYGWRALLVMVLVVGTAAATIPVWRQIGSYGRQMRFSHGIYMAILFSLMLPAHWASIESPFAPCPGGLWMLAAGAGILVSFCTWLMGGVGSGRVHPLLAAYLLLAVFFGPWLEGHWVLQRNRLASGDAAKAYALETYPSAAEGWSSSRIIPGYDALAIRPASSRLIEFTSGQGGAKESGRSLISVLRDEMPPLEDLLTGGQPGPIGATSAIAIIVGGLFLLYRGVSDFRIPLLIILGAMASLMILPIPVAFEEMKPVWQWVVMRHPGVGIASALTFANYELLAGPLLLTAFFLATAPSIRPMTRRGRVIYALLIGIAAAAAQLYVSVSFGAYIALVIVSAFTPLFDRLFRPHTLV